MKITIFHSSHKTTITKTFSLSFLMGEYQTNVENFHILKYMKKEKFRQEHIGKSRRKYCSTNWHIWERKQMEAVESFVEVLAENPDKDFILRGDFMSWENNIIVCLSERKKIEFRI